MNTKLENNLLSSRTTACALAHAHKSGAVFQGATGATLFIIGAAGLAVSFFCAAAFCLDPAAVATAVGLDWRLEHLVNMWPLPGAFGIPAACGSFFILLELALCLITAMCADMTFVWFVFFRNNPRPDACAPADGAKTITTGWGPAMLVYVNIFAGLVAIQSVYVVLFALFTTDMMVPAAIPSLYTYTSRDALIAYAVLFLFALGTIVYHTDRLPLRGFVLFNAIALVLTGGFALFNAIALVLTDIPPAFSSVDFFEHLAPSLGPMGVIYVNLVGYCAVMLDIPLCAAVVSLGCRAGYTLTHRPGKYDITPTFGEDTM
jgi:hypothetical protein